MATIKINATKKAQSQAAQLAEALNLRPEEVTERAMALLWKNHIGDVRRHLQQIDDTSALFNGNEPEASFEE